MGKSEETVREKKKIRAQGLKRRDSLTREQREDAGRRIIDELTKLPCYENADAVLTYISFRGEVDTFPLIERAFADGKAVFAPKVAGRGMEFYRIFSVDDLAEGYRGILEPRDGISYTDWISQKREKELSRALICLPGAAFDRARHRIGYGGGFYDRYLNGRLQESENAEAAARRLAGAEFTTAALAFDCQIFEEIPWEAHDFRSERIVTEREIL